MTAPTVLALETATRAGSVAVLRGTRMLDARAGDPARPHGTRLPGDLLAALDRSGLTLRDVDLLAVCLGPGAFTGLRVGIASIQGLAMGAGLPVVGVSALDALAVAAAEASGAERIGVWIDAARGEVFAARYARDPGTVLGVAPADEPVSAKPATVVESWRAQPPGVLIGDGTIRFPLEASILGAQVLPTPDLLAPIVARCAARLAEHGAAGRPHALRPVYVRRPDAELAREARHAPSR